MAKQTNSQAVTDAAVRPLVVKLNGTLVKSNTLFDSLLMLVRMRPALLWQLLRWGKLRAGGFRARLESAASLDVRHLPYNRALLAYLRQQKAEGRSVYLASTSDGRLAQRIVEHLDVFTGKLLIGGQNGIGIRTQGPWAMEGAFDFIGSTMDDFQYLRRATDTMLANPDRALLHTLTSNRINVSGQFNDRIAPFAAFRKAIRLHQWAKNLLVFVPLLLAHLVNPQTLWRTALAFVCFSLCASATYLVNDLLDLDADRKHPTKRRRAFAAGDLSASAGLAIIALFLALGLAGARFLSAAFLMWLLGYLTATLAYSFWLKRVVLVDVIMLAALYTVRLLAGAAVSGILVSPWLSGFSLFLFLSLAMVKRFSELDNLRVANQIPENGRGYLLLDLESLRSFGTASGFASIVIFALYINSHDVLTLYRHSNRMWLIAPLLIWWVSRFWLLAARGQMDEDPVVFAITDRISLFIGVAIAVIGAFAL